MKEGSLIDNKLNKEQDLNKGLGHIKRTKLKFGGYHNKYYDYYHTKLDMKDLKMALKQRIYYIQQDTCKTNLLYNLVVIQLN